MTPAKPGNLIDDLQALSDDLDDGTGNNPRANSKTTPAPDPVSVESLVDELVAAHLPAIEAELRQRLAKLGNEELRALRKRGK